MKVEARGKRESGFNATERGVYAASTWKNERFRISHVAMNFDPAVRDGMNAALLQFLESAFRQPVSGSFFLESRPDLDPVVAWRLDRVGNGQRVGDGGGRVVGVDGGPWTAEAARLLNKLTNGLSTRPVQRHVSASWLNAGKLQNRT